MPRLVDLTFFIGLLFAAAAQAFQVDRFTPQGEVARVNQVHARFSEDVITSYSIHYTKLYDTREQQADAERQADQASHQRGRCVRCESGRWFSSAFSVPPKRWLMMRGIARKSCGKPSSMRLA